jgi:penicillin-binding protein 1A
MSRSPKRRNGRPKARRPARRPRGGGLLRFLLLALVLAVGGTAAWLWPRCSGAGCPSVGALRSYTPPQASRVFDREGQLLAHLAPERRIVVPLERIPSHVAGAFLAVEDKRFFQHRGIDYRRVVGAAIRDLQVMRFDEGFSTITMQLARNVFPEHLTRAKTIRRKVWEVMLAREIEREFSKDQILEMYLNQIYLGDGLYGVEAAAQGYFGRTARELTPVQAALLAALPKAPNAFNPRRNPTGAVQRRNLVLRLMGEAGVVSPAEATRLAGTPLGLVAPMEARGEAPYLVAAIRKELRERFGVEAEQAGYRVHTGLDRELQRAATEALRAQLAAVEAGELGRYRGPNCAAGAVERPETCLQGMFVAMDVRTGDIRALVGGRDFALSQFDRATQARRQAGSAFKPIVYATALAAGIPITTPLIGPEAIDYEGGYRPADHVGDGANLNLRDAMRVSSNRAAVVLGERVGVQNVVNTAKTMGFSTPIQLYPSTFLGASDVIPLELVAAYTTFANAGIYTAPRLIRRVEDASGRLVWEAPVERRAALSPEVAYLTTSLMQDVVDRGTGHRVRAAGLPYSVPAAGKTGTTNDAADTWFVGVTPDLAAGVWIGFDRPQRIMVGADGGRLAAPVWGRALAAYYRKHPAPGQWARPIDLVSATIDPQTGLLATSACPQESRVTEWFLPGTEPHEYCPLHGEPGIDGWLRRQFRGLGDWLGGRRAAPR